MTRTWIWLGIRLDLPEDWELLQFTRDPAQGRCAFADRYQFRLELDWRSVPGPPDFGRMMNDYQTKLAGEGMADIEPLRRGAWLGFHGRTAAGVSSRFGRFLPGRKRLVELVFPWPRQREAAVEGAILDRVTEELARDDGRQRWCAFGMDLLVEAEAGLVDCTVQPAHAELVFAPRRGPDETRWARRGMVREWLAMPLDEWLNRWVGTDAVERASASRELAGHTVYSLTGRKPRPGLFRRPLFLQAATWLCPRDGRLYSISRQTAQAPAASALAGDRLVCCPDLQA
jgi:hypothetical protein